MNPRDQNNQFSIVQISLFNPQQNPQIPAPQFQQMTQQLGAWRQQMQPQYAQTPRQPVGTTTPPTAAG